jgi:hypothetical protein
MESLTDPPLRPASGTSVLLSKRFRCGFGCRLPREGTGLRAEVAPLTMVLD